MGFQTAGAILETQGIRVHSIHKARRPAGGKAFQAIHKRNGGIPSRFPRLHKLASDPTFGFLRRPCFLRNRFRGKPKGPKPRGSSPGCFRRGSPQNPGGARKPPPMDWPSSRGHTRRHRSRPSPRPARARRVPHPLKPRFTKSTLRDRPRWPHQLSGPVFSVPSWVMLEP